MALTQFRVTHYLALLSLVAAAAFAQVAPVTTTSVASYGPIVAPDSIGAAWGTTLSTTIASALGTTLPTTLGSTTVMITDSAGMTFSAPLFLVSPTQINFLVPAGVALGNATLTVANPKASYTGSLLVSNVAPGIFTANGDAKGVPAAQVVRVSGGKLTYETPYQAGGAVAYTTNPINLTSSTDQVYLVLYGTGIRRHSLNPVVATINGVKVPVAYAGPQNQYPGLDQVNLGPLPTSLTGSGEVDLRLLVDGVPANTVRVAVR
jgi:uncharacterized protein (TIGR03437 family)